MYVPFTPNFLVTILREFFFQLQAAPAVATEDLFISGQDLSADLVEVLGLTLLRAQSGLTAREAAAPQTFVATASAAANLHSVALALSLHRAILLEGPTGAGKTALIEYLAHLTAHAQDHGLLRIQMSDQTDAKVKLLFSLWCPYWTAFSLAQCRHILAFFFSFRYDLGAPGHLCLHGCPWSIQISGGNSYSGGAPGSLAVD